LICLKIRERVSRWEDYSIIDFRFRYDAFSPFLFEECFKRVRLFLNIYL